MGVTSKQDNGHVSVLIMKINIHKGLKIRKEGDTKIMDAVLRLGPYSQKRSSSS